MATLSITMKTFDRNLDFLYNSLQQCYTNIEHFSYLTLYTQNFKDKKKHWKTVFINAYLRLVNTDCQF
jgi:hypothetical protein